VERGRRDEGLREALSLTALPWVNTALSSSGVKAIEPSSPTFGMDPTT